MTGMTVGVTGAAGQLGSLVAEQLLERIAPEQLVLITRRPEALSAFAQRGASVRRADFDEPGTLRPALAGVDRLLLISSTHESTPRRVEQHTGVIEAAKAQGVTHVAFTSMPKVDADHPSNPYALEYPASEQVLKDSGLAWTILQNGPYAEYLVGRLAMAVATGRLISNAGDGRTAPVSNADCAAVAVAVLTEDGHTETTYVVTGPQLYSQGELAALASELSGRDVDLLELEDEAFTAQAAADGVPEPYPQLMTNHLHAVRLGHFDDLTDTVERVTGRAPRTLRAVLLEHRDELLPVGA
jgi:NAD(P)H dehydrogenase (quinone)